jgi:hypothetical protein
MNEIFLLEKYFLISFNVYDNLSIKSKKIKKLR